MTVRRPQEPARTLQALLDTMLATRRILSDRIGASQRRVFVALALHPLSSIGEIAELIEVSDSIASRGVSVLIELGLAECVVDLKERRRHLVRLTESGEHMARDLAKTVREILHEPLRV